MTKNRNIPADQFATDMLLENGADNLSTLKSWLGHTRKAAILDNKLLVGATFEDLRSVRGAVKEHLFHLKHEHGIECVETNGIIQIQKSGRG